ncbi:helix-turn-helix domain-containing protein [Kribbella sp. NPDC006257]|jgi:AcrR family transcriptional regulator|uniref:TetR/AcrR family transcriptional regulator n=1 Tax=Kribbella sp. NPDC006257 TaxID=3156738 RepID=UPI0033A7534E
MRTPHRPHRVRKADPGGTDAARTRILDAAEQLFAEDGFDATPTKRVADRAGVAKGLLFYYFPKKLDLLRALFAERLPPHPLCAIDDLVVAGDVPGSLVRLAGELDLGRHESQVLRTILFREASTYLEVRDYLHALHSGLIELTERVLDAASPASLDRRRRRQAADTYVAVLLHEANARRFDGPLPDINAAADIVARALAA